MSDFDEINRRFQQAVQHIEGGLTERAITMVLIQVGANTAPMIPIDTSNLINSQYRKVDKTAAGWKGELGYGARYAAAVHEASGKLKGTPRPKNRGTYWGPSGEPKFLEKGIEETIPQLNQILREEYSE